MWIASYTGPFGSVVSRRSIGGSAGSDWVNRHDVEGLGT